MSEDRNFREVFKQEHDNIKSQIESGGHTQESMLKNIEELQKRVQQRRDKLAKFDHEFYGSSLQKLRESVWKQRKPAKVTFKAKIGKPKATTGSQLATSVTSEPLSLKTSAIFEESTQANVSISNMRNSTVVYKNVEGAVYLDNVQDSRVYVRAQQCRIHDSQNVTIWLEKCIGPILESSKNIHFVVPDSDFTPFDFIAPDERNFDVKKIPLESWHTIESLDESVLK